MKEAILLNNNQYRVTFIYARISAWANDFDEKLFSANKEITWIGVGKDAKMQPVGYFRSRLRKKIHYSLAKLGLQSKNAKSTVLYSQELKQKANSIKAEIYIAHNLGALDAAVSAAKKFAAFSVFDAEDFHRGEFRENGFDREAVVAIENRLFLAVSFITAASPMIAAAYQQLFPAKKIETINNVFPLLKKERTVTASTGVLKLFWFSQFIGPHRGLEQILAALQLCGPVRFELHLLGNISDAYKSQLISWAPYPELLYFMPVVAPDAIFDVASTFDIGLACEVPDTVNRQYCLTNKIFTYLVAGNCVCYSNTPAQKQFFEENPSTGILFDFSDPTDLAAQLRLLAENPHMLFEKKQAARAAAERTYNWAIEGNRYLELLQANFATH